MTDDIIDRVVTVVDYQIGGPQPPTLPADKVVMILAVHGNESAPRVREALDEAVEAGRLERDEEHVWLSE